MSLARVKGRGERGGVEGEGRCGGELGEVVVKDGGVVGGGWGKGSGEGCRRACECRLERGEAACVEDELLDWGGW